jgi:hypothetical protein
MTKGSKDMHNTNYYKHGNTIIKTRKDEKIMTTKGYTNILQLRDDTWKEDGSSQSDGAKHKQNMELHKQSILPNSKP